MNNNTIAENRLSNQGINTYTVTTPGEAVHRMGAIQAQDYRMAKYAVGIRLQGSTDIQIETAFNEGTILRTHLLRPTLHFVSARDIRWMTELSARQINRAAASMDKILELDEKIFTKSLKIIEKLLAGGISLTRKEISAALNSEKIITNSQRTGHILLRAETEAIVCSGPIKGKQQTYALLDERAPSIRKTAKDEALTELALRYFSSHGPATIQDFHWWSGLKAADARAGLEFAKDKLISEKIEDTEYWFAEGQTVNISTKGKVYFLPAFDEYLVSYKDRSASLGREITREVITVNGIFKPVIIRDGKVVGKWSRKVNNHGIIIETILFGNERSLNKQEMSAFVKSYEKYSGIKVKFGG